MKTYKLAKLGKENTELKEEVNLFKSLEETHRNHIKSLEKQLAITKEKIIEVLKDYYFEDEEDIKLFEQMASEILGDKEKIIIKYEKSDLVLANGKKLILRKR